jgi:hypothetical protein
MLEHPVNSRRQITDEIESARPQHFALTKLGFFMELPLPWSPGALIIARSKGI